MSTKNGKKTAKTTGTKVPKKAKAAPTADSEAPPVIENAAPAVPEIEAPDEERPAEEGSAEMVATDGASAAAVPEAPAVETEPAAPSGKLSALDAEVRVLEESGRPMTCKELIATMALKGYWTTPGGKTPWATLYAAILREISVKGKQARFAKASRGHFARANLEA
jgi:hypothetical protein